MTRRSPFRYFRTNPEIILLAVMMCSRFLLSLCNVEDLLRARGIDICHATVRFWWRRFGPMFAALHMKRHGCLDEIVTDRLWSCGAALREPGIGDRQETGRRANNRAAALAGWPGLLAA